MIATTTNTISAAITMLKVNSPYLYRGCRVPSGSPYVIKSVANGFLPAVRLGARPSQVQLAPLDPPGEVF